MILYLGDEHETDRATRRCQCQRLGDAVDLMVYQYWQCRRKEVHSVEAVARHFGLERRTVVDVLKRWPRGATGRARPCSV